MSSPILHGLVGMGMAYAAAARHPHETPPPLLRQLPRLLIGGALACLPDVDYLPGILTGNLNAYHQQFTHSLLFCIAAAILLSPALKRWFSMPVILLLILSHLMIDFFTADHSLPYGIPLFWGFRTDFFHSPWAPLPAWAKDQMGDLFTLHNIRPAAIEATIGLIFCTACAAKTRICQRLAKPA